MASEMQVLTVDARSQILNRGPYQMGEISGLSARAALVAKPDHDPSDPDHVHSPGTRLVFDVHRLVQRLAAECLVLPEGSG